MVGGSVPPTPPPHFLKRKASISPPDRPPEFHEGLCPSNSPSAAPPCLHRTKKIEDNMTQSISTYMYFLRHLQASGGTQEAPRYAHEALRRHPEGSQEHPGGIRRHPGHQRGLWVKRCKNHIVLWSKVARPTVLRRQERPDPHQVCNLRTKVSGRRVAAPSLMST